MPDSISKAKILICLPVYNGAETTADGTIKLRRQLDSILAQTCSDYSLLIIDNKSTDATPDICREYADRDARVQYHCSQRNRGGYFSVIRGMFQGLFHEYFIYASHNDYWAPEYLAECLAALENNPKASLAYSHCRLMNLKTGEESIYSDPFDMADLEFDRRYLTVLLQIGLCTAYYGLIRSSFLIGNMHSLFQPSAAGDNLLLARLAWDGPFIQIPKVLFFREISAEKIDETMEERRQRLAEYGRLKWVPPWQSSFTDHVFSHCNLILNSVIGDANEDVGLESKRQFFARKSNAIAGTVQALKSRYLPFMEDEQQLTLDLLLSGRLFHAFMRALPADMPLNEIIRAYPALCSHALNLTAEVQARQCWLGVAVPGFHYGRALVQLLLGRKAAALEAVEEELSSNPTHRLSLEMKNKLTPDGKV